jgi:hypothetical protein
VGIILYIEPDSTSVQPEQIYYSGSEECQLHAAAVLPSVPMGSEVVWATETVRTPWIREESRDLDRPVTILTGLPWRITGRRVKMVKACSVSEGPAMASPVAFLQSSLSNQRHLWLPLGPSTGHFPRPPHHTCNLPRALRP